MYTCVCLFRSQTSAQQKAKPVSDENVPLSHKDKDGEAEDKSTQVVVTSGKTYDPSLTKALARAFGGTFLVAAFFKLIHDILMFVSPQLLK